MTPIQVLMEEHKLILAVLDSLEEGAERLDSGDQVDPDFFLDAAVMLSEQDEGRRYTAGFRSAAQQMKDGDANAAADVIRNAFDYVNLLREHIVKEDNVLYPMAEQMIPVDAMARMSEEFQRVIDTDEKNEVPEKYRALAEKLNRYLAEETSAA